ncbi:carbohydrate ABC transporter permease [Rhizomonospora bruguierae]|uniref:carbohydrate ABC transporter permease n=1 Tax=Rhizomonospora bruguierae TaxID=1581705 RepID=UPI0020C13787|nr:carbohydrate ABC transporter permease [Micromonospora sp. NBRC 107566]
MTDPPAPQTPGPPRPPARRRRHRGTVRAVLKHVWLIALAMTMIYPLIWLVVSSFKPTDTIFRNMSIIPDEVTLANYTNGWHAFADPFSTFLWNSVFIAFWAIVGNLLTCSLAAYGFARTRFRGRGIMFAVMLLTLMLPFQVTVVPQYIVFKELGWVNTVLPLIVPKFLATDAFFVFLMVQFIRGLPRELDEAARIDGAGHFRTYYRIILPLMTPALAATAIFTFIWTWNDFFTQLLYLTSLDKKTAAVALNMYLDASSTSDYGAMFAMSVISLAPLFFVFLFGQRWLIRGIATTGIK